MDLSNVVFIESKMNKKKSPSNGRNKKKQQNEKTAMHKVRNAKHVNRSNKRSEVTVGGAKQMKANSKSNERKDNTENATKDGVFHPKNWVKIPPDQGEPTTRTKNGKTYHWCHHCKYWSRHRPGKGKLCQAVDPLAHLLNYFGGKSLSAPGAQDAITMDIDWDDF